MQSRKKRKIIIATLCAIIVGMTVGYSVLGQLLNINGTSQVLADFNIQFTKIDENTMVNAKTITKGGVGTTTANFTVDLVKPGSSALYDLTVSNLGTIDAVLKSIEGLDESNKQEPLDIQFSLVGIKKGDFLNAGDSKTFQVRVEWDINSSTIPTNSKKLVLTLNYEQKSGTGGDDSELVASDYLIKNALETDITNPGNGLYPIDHNSEITTSDNPREYRYLGAKPNNYVSFGTYTKNEEYYAIQYISKANRDLITSYYFTTKEDCQKWTSLIGWEDPQVTKDCTLVQHSVGDPVIWQIVGIFDGHLKLIKTDHLVEEKWASQFNDGKNSISVWDDANSMNWNNASLNTYLNETYYQTFTPENQAKIETMTWNLGNMQLSDMSQESIQKVYEQEQNPTSEYKTWTGKIGLIYFTDYILSTSGSSTAPRSTCLTNGWSNWMDNSGSFGLNLDDCRKNDWLYGNSARSWSINPVSGFGIAVINDNTGYLPQSSYANVYPSFYLKSDVQIVGGTGTLGDPYILN